MAREYLAPGVYTETVQPVGRPIHGVSTTTGVLVGLAERGPINQPIMVTSWQEYIQRYAGGLASPFMRDSDLAYAVYGFFQNGGRRTYILRVGNVRPLTPLNLPRPAFADIGTNGQRVYARDEGAWGNHLRVVVRENEHDSIYDNSTDPPTLIEQRYDIIVYFRGEPVEFWRNWSNNQSSRNYFERITLQSNFIRFEGEEEIVVGEYTLGALLPNGQPDLTAANVGSDGREVFAIDYLAALRNLEELPDRNLLAVPGQESRIMIRGILDWCEEDERTFPIIGMPPFMTAQQLRDERRQIGSAVRGALYAPWFTVLDPLSVNGEPRLMPPEGHLMGIFARQTNDRGVHKAPAGVTANVRGIVDVVKPFAFGDSEIANPASVNLVMNRPNYGNVVWGARTINTDRTKLYVSDQRLNMFIKQSLEEGTQWAVFEPNDHRLWKALYVSCYEFLHVLWSVHGSLFGETSDEAFFVKCDADNNPRETQYLGKVFVDVGYAPVKPAEFVIIRVAHSMRHIN